MYYIAMAETHSDFSKNKMYGATLKISETDQLYIPLNPESSSIRLLIAVLKMIVSRWKRELKGRMNVCTV